MIERDEARAAMEKIREGLTALGVRWIEPAGSAPLAMRTIIPLNQTEEAADCSFFGLDFALTAEGAIVSLDMRTMTWEQCPAWGGA